MTAFQPFGSANPQLPPSSARAILPTVTASLMAVFLHRGLAPRQLTPMSGASTEDDHSRGYPFRFA